MISNLIITIPLSELEDYDTDSNEEYRWDIENRDSKKSNKSRKIKNAKNNDYVLVEEDDRYVLKSGDDNIMNNCVDKPISKDSSRPVSDQIL